MRIYYKENVFDAALNRIRWLFDEFPVIVCAISGGKDSTVVFNLCKMVAAEKGRLPLRVMFIDQEAEWQATIDTVRLIMEDPDVEPYWYQVPIKLFNATSSKENWLQCWDPAAEDRWMRPKELYSIKENTFGTDRFAELFDAVISHTYPDTPACIIGGVRCEESPVRSLGLTMKACYKGETWGKKLDAKRGHYVMYPIYDWSYSDVWKAIHSNGWHYNPLYDYQYSYGVTVMDMRVSNLHHETAVKNLFYLQEVEPDTYVRLTQRLSGIDSAGKLGKDDYFVRELPFMFASWREYRDFLLDKLVDNPEWREGFRKAFERQDRLYYDEIGDKLHRVHVQSILTNDWEHVKLINFEQSPKIRKIKKRNKRLALEADQ